MLWGVKGFLAVLAILMLASAAASGHPLIENGMEVVDWRDRVTLRATISLPEIDIAHTIDESVSGAIPAAKIRRAVDAHADYLISHLTVSADGAALKGKLVAATPPEGEVTWAAIEEVRATYDIEYPLVAPPKKVEIKHELLKEFSRLGQPWQVLFVVQAKQAGATAFTEYVLTGEDSVEIPCAWRADASTTAPTVVAAPPPPPASRWRVARSFTIHGFEHIVTGYDHLLFVAALVIGATRLWDLVKVVTAFAVAHTLTLTLSVLDLVRLPSSVVEPIIAASIVFVAMQNVLFPRQSRGNARLAVAFGFGLFHGLGFAGGLLQVMADMPTVSLVVALVSFTLGVEVAHQALIVPLYLVLKPLRRSVADMGEASDPAPPRLVMPLRFASLLISLAGLFYLVQALRGA
jgi:hydrogenase/urease accessory protein HupE